MSSAPRRPLSIPCAPQPVPELAAAPPPQPVPALAAAPPPQPRTMGSGQRRGRHAANGSFAGQLVHRAGLLAALAAIVAGLAIGGHIGYFYWRSHTVGDALIAQERSQINQARHSPGGSACTAEPPAAPDGSRNGSIGGQPSASGLISAPAIGLQAPVVEGVGNPQLNVAVGHVPGSVWPGQLGTAILAAHDVSWFSRINLLRPGDTVTFADRCETLRYRVTGSEVVKTGTPLYSTLVPVLALVTCYPLNALFLTPDRYVVEADLVTVVHQGSSAPATLPLPPPLEVPAPPALESQGLTLATNDAPLGTLELAGSPSEAWQQSPVPLQVESSVLALYFAAIRSAEQHQPGWWQAVVPGVPFSRAAPLVGATIVRNDRSVSPVLDVTGTTVTGATVSSLPQVSGGATPGVYRMTMTAVVRGQTLVATGWSMVPAPA